MKNLDKIVQIRAKIDQKLDKNRWQQHKINKIWDKIIKLR